MQTTIVIENGKGELPGPVGDGKPVGASQSILRFHSILSETPANNTLNEAIQQPDYFPDLNLDQIVHAITAGREEYNLKPFFYTRLSTLATIAYRHEIMRDLERDLLFQDIKSLSARMHSMRVRLTAAEKSCYKYQKEALFLEAAEIYCDAVEALLSNLRDHQPSSQGLLAFRNYLSEYVASDAFTTLASDARNRRSELSAIRYAVLINGSSVTVQNPNSEPDYTESVEKTFAKFKQGAVRDYLVKYSEFPEMNHVEAMVLDRVALLNPQVFLALDEFCARHATFPDRTIGDFDRGVQFYVAWLEHSRKFMHADLQFCYPRVSDADKTVSARDSFDLALAGNVLGSAPASGPSNSSRDTSSAIVGNDFSLSGNQRIFVVSGPNQGGKTTFARMFGQLHFMASLGVPVPGTDAQLFLCDQIFTHFERKEDITTLHGKLEDDLVRIHQILQRATPNSAIVINEIFSSTSLKDAVYLGSNVIERITQLDALCVCVTFLDELSCLNDKTVSMVAEVVSNDSTSRTFKMRRRPADGLAYAMAIAEKYRLTYAQLKERLKP